MGYVTGTMSSLQMFTQEKPHQNELIIIIKIEQYVYRIGLKDLLQGCCYCFLAVLRILLCNIHF